MSGSLPLLSFGFSIVDGQMVDCNFVVAMASIGATNPNPKPQGSETNRVQVDAFVEEA